MPNPEVAILIRGIDRATGVFRKLGSATSGIFSTLAKSAAMAGVGIAAATGVASAAFTKMAFEAAKQQETFDLLADTVERTGVSWSSVAKDVKGLADEIQAMTKYGDVETAYVLQELTTFTGDLSKSMDAALTVYDLAAAKHMDYATSARYVGMALSGNVEMLGRYIPEFKASAGVIDKSMSVNEKAAIAMEVLNEKFGGAAQAQLRNFMGYLAQMKNYMGDLSEAIGDRLIPIFEDVFQLITQEVKRAVEVIESGRFDDIFLGWGVAAEGMLTQISEAVAIVGPFLLDEFKNLGEVVAEFVTSFDVEAIGMWTEKVISFGKVVAKTSWTIAEFTIHHGKLLASLAGLVILAGVTIKIIAFMKAMKAAILVVKGFALAHTMLMSAMGPVGLALAVGGLILTGLLLYRKRMKAAKEETASFREELRRLEIEKALEGLTTSIEQGEAITGLIEKHKKILSGYRKQLKGLTEEHKSGAVSSKEYRRDQRLLFRGMQKQVDIIDRLKKEYADLGLTMEEEVAAAPPPPPPPPPDIEPSKEVLKLRADLNRELEAMTLSQLAFQKKEIERWSKEKRKLAQEDQLLIESINRLETLKLAKLDEEYSEKARVEAQKRIEARKKEARDNWETGVKAQIELFRLQGEETKALQMEAGLRKTINFETFKNAALANQMYQAEIDQIREAGITEDSLAAKEKLNINRQLQIATMEVEGKRREAALKGLDMEIEEWQARGAKGIALEDYRRVKMAEINAQFDEEEAKETRAKIEAIRSAEVGLRNDLASLRMGDFELASYQLDQEVAKYQEAKVNEVLLEEWRKAQTEAIKLNEVERIVALEKEKIGAMREEFSSYAMTAMAIGEELFSSQEAGWMKAIIYLVKWGARLLSEYLLAKAFEKGKEAAILKTASTEARTHAQKMARMAAEFALQGDLIRAGIAGAKAMLGMAEAGALMAESKSLEKQAKTLTIASVAAQVAGEVSAVALEKSMKNQQRVAKEQKKIQKDRAKIEKDIQADIVGFEKGRAGLEQARLEDKIKEYRQLGIETGLLERWRTAKEAEVAEMTGTTGIQPTLPRLPEPTPTPSPTSPIFQERAGGQVIVNQTVYIDGWINTADREHLTKLVEKMVPFNDEVEKQWRAS